MQTSAVPGVVGPVGEHAADCIASGARAPKTGLKKILKENNLKKAVLERFLSKAPVVMATKTPPKRKAMSERPLSPIKTSRQRASWF